MTFAARPAFGASSGGGSGFRFEPAPTDLMAARTGAGFVQTVYSGGAVTGGVEPYSYYWLNTSGDSFAIQDITTFQARFSDTLPAMTSRSGVYNLTVFDATSASINTNITVSLTSL